MTLNGTYGRVQGERGSWTEDTIGLYAQQNKETEWIMKGILSNFAWGDFAYKMEVRWAISPGQGDRAAMDLAIFYIGNRDQEKRIAIIELECGKEQGHWKNKIPSHVRWPRGLSFLGRKNPRKYDFFLKYSLTYQSGFCVWCPWLVESIESGRLSLGDTNSASTMDKKGIGTNHSGYAIPWNIIPEIAWGHPDVCQFPPARFGRGSPDGSLLLVENGEWGQFWEFLNDKPLNVDENSNPPYV
jgi:hypothetical protein